jgi:FKBP-type peptidyl-prolyl cis-trans isomerase SlyD
VPPGLEKQLYDMSVGEGKIVELAPEDGYGLADKEAFSELERGEFPKEIPLQPGVELQMKDEDGQNHYAWIESVEGDKVRLNFNHALAGKTLHFDLRVVGIRSATEEEKEQGYAG